MAILEGATSLMVFWFMLMLGTAEASYAQDQPIPTQTVSLANEAVSTDMDTSALMEVFVMFLVLSVAFEESLAPIFGWRYFRKHASGKGVKTPIKIGLAFFLFWGYDLDIFARLLTSLGEPTELHLMGQLFTALMIGGGSAGVYSIALKLGWRLPGAPVDDPSGKKAAPLPVEPAPS